MRLLTLIVFLFSCTPIQKNPQTYIDVPYTTSKLQALGDMNLIEAEIALKECTAEVEKNPVMPRIAVDKYFVECMRRHGYIFRIERK